MQKNDDLTLYQGGDTLHQRVNDILKIKNKYVQINNNEIWYIKDCSQIHAGKHGMPRFRITYFTRDDNTNCMSCHSVYDKYYIKGGFDKELSEEIKKEATDIDGTYEIID